MIGAESALITVPIGFIIVFLFRKTAPRPTQILRKSIIESLQSDADSVSSSDSSSSAGSTDKISAIGRKRGLSRLQATLLLVLPMDPVVLTESLEDRVFSSVVYPTEMKREDSKKSKIKKFFPWCKGKEGAPEDDSAGVSSSQHPNAHRSQHESSKTRQSKIKQFFSCKKKKPKETKTNSPFLFPWWCIYISWSICLGSTAVAAYLVVLYGLSFGSVKSYLWLTSMASTIVTKIFVIEPFKIILIAFILSLIFKTQPKEMDLESGAPLEIELPKIYQKRLSQSEIEELKYKRTEGVYQPIPDEELEILRQRERKRRKLGDMMYDLIMYVVYIIIVYCVVLFKKDQLAYQSTRNVQNLFIDAAYWGSTKLEEVTDYSKLIDYLNSTFIPSLHEVKLYNGDDTREMGWTADLNSKLLGVARFRQLRICNSSCTIPEKFKDHIKHCWAAFSTSIEDQMNYSISWTKLDNISYSERARTPWLYQTSWNSRSWPLLGEFAWYPGGGYISNLGRTRENSRRVLQFLVDHNWFDHLTRVFMVEFTLYNVNRNLFNVVTLLVEVDPTGACVTTHNIKTATLLYVHDKNHKIQVVLFFLFLLMLVALLFRQLVSLKKLPLRMYFSKFWNIMDVTIILMGVSCIGMFFARNSYVTSLLEELAEADDNEFVSFYGACYLDEVLSYLMAFLICLSTIRLWKLLRFGEKFQIFELTLLLARHSLLSITLMYIILLGAFSCLAFLIVGRLVQDFRDTYHCLSTLVSFSLGFNEYLEFNTFAEANRILGPVFFFSYSLTCVVYIMNMFITIMIVYYASAQLQISAKENTYNLYNFILDEFHYYFRKSSNQNRSSGVIRLRGGSDKPELNADAQESTDNRTHSYGSSTSGYIHAENVDDQHSWAGEESLGSHLDLGDQESGEIMDEEEGGSYYYDDDDDPTKSQETETEHESRSQTASRRGSSTSQSIERRPSYGRRLSIPQIRHELKKQRILRDKGLIGVEQDDGSLALPGGYQADDAKPENLKAGYESKPPSPTPSRSSIRSKGRKRSVSKVKMDDDTKQKKKNARRESKTPSPTPSRSSIRSKGRTGSVSKGKKDDDAKQKKHIARRESKTPSLTPSRSSIRSKGRTGSVSKGKKDDDAKQKKHIARRESKTPSPTPSRSSIRSKGRKGSVSKGRKDDDAKQKKHIARRKSKTPSPTPSRSSIRSKGRKGSVSKGRKDDDAKQKKKNARRESKTPSPTPSRSSIRSMGRTGSVSKGKKEDDAKQKKKIARRESKTLSPTPSRSSIRSKGHKGSVSKGKKDDDAKQKKRNPRRESKTPSPTPSRSSIRSKGRKGSVSKVRMSDDIKAGHKSKLRTSSSTSIRRRQNSVSDSEDKMDDDDAKHKSIHIGHELKTLSPNPYKHSLTPSRSVKSPVCTQSVSIVRMCNNETQTEHESKRPAQRFKGPVSIVRMHDDETQTGHKSRRPSQRSSIQYLDHRESQSVSKDGKDDDDNVGAQSEYDSPTPSSSSKISLGRKKSSGSGKKRKDSKRVSKNKKSPSRKGSVGSLGSRGSAKRRSVSKERKDDDDENYGAQSELDSPTPSSSSKISLGRKKSSGSGKKRKDSKRVSKNKISPSRKGSVGSLGSRVSVKRQSVSKERKDDDDENYGAQSEHDSPTPSASSKISLGRKKSSGSGKKKKDSKIISTAKRQTPTRRSASEGMMDDDAEKDREDPTKNKQIQTGVIDDDSTKHKQIQTGAMHYDSPKHKQTHPGVWYEDQTGHKKIQTGMMDDDPTKHKRIQSGVMADDPTKHKRRQTGVMADDPTKHKRRQTGVIDDDPTKDKEIQTGMMDDDPTKHKRIQSGLMADDPTKHKRRQTGVMDDDTTKDKEIQTGMMDDDPTKHIEIQTYEHPTEHKQIQTCKDPTEYKQTQTRWLHKKSSKEKVQRRASVRWFEPDELSVRNRPSKHGSKPPSPTPSSSSKISLGRKKSSGSGKKKKDPVPKELSDKETQKQNIFKDQWTRVTMDIQQTHINKMFRDQGTQVSKNKEIQIQKMFSDRESLVSRGKDIQKCQESHIDDGGPLKGKKILIQKQFKDQEFQFPKNVMDGGDLTKNKKMLTLNKSNTPIDDDAKDRINFITKCKNILALYKSKLSSSTISTDNKDQKLRETAGQTESKEIIDDAKHRRGLSKDKNILVLRKSKSPTTSGHIGDDKSRRAVQQPFSKSEETQRQQLEEADAMDEQFIELIRKPKRRVLDVQADILLKVNVPSAVSLGREFGACGKDEAMIDSTQSEADNMNIIQWRPDSKMLPVASKDPIHIVRSGKWRHGTYREALSAQQYLGSKEIIKSIQFSKCLYETCSRRDLMGSDTHLCEYVGPLRASGIDINVGAEICSQRPPTSRGANSAYSQADNRNSNPFVIEPLFHRHCSRCRNNFPCSKYKLRHSPSRCSPM